MVSAKGAFLRVVTSLVVLATSEIGESGPRRGDEKMSVTQTSKKLYFNITWAAGATASHKFIPCTPFRTSTTFGDRYGSLLEALGALTGNSPNTLKRNNAVSAWFVASQGTAIAITSAGGTPLIDFVAPTYAVSGNSSLGSAAPVPERRRDVRQPQQGQGHHLRDARPTAALLDSAGAPDHRERHVLGRAVRRAPALDRGLGTTRRSC